MAPDIRSGRNNGQQQHVMRQHLQTRNLTINRRRTSVRLEPTLWNALQEIAEKREMTIHELATEIAKERPSESSLTSSIRTYIVKFYRAMSLEPSLINSFLEGAAGTRKSNEHTLH